MQDHVFNLEYGDKEILARYSLNEIKMIGFLTNLIGKTRGLIWLPNNNFYKVELDDRFGLEQGHIVLIDTEKIVIQEKNKKETNAL